MKLVFISTIFGAIISTSHSIAPHSKKYLKDNKDTIVGGYNASIEDFPYQVGIYYGRGDEHDEFQCGGSIISERYILTAAHCLPKRNPPQLIRMGSEFKNKGTALPIAEVIPHPDFDEITAKLDVGIIKTKNQIEFSNVIKPIKLPPKGRYVKDESMFTVSGWGDVWYNETFEDEGDGLLKAVNISVFNFEKCEEILKNYIKISKDSDWCGGGLEKGGKGSCYGDSGGPAVQDNMIVGIVSSGLPGCALPNTPDIYTNVAAPAVRDFIKEHTGL